MATATIVVIPTITTTIVMTTVTATVVVAAATATVMAATAVWLTAAAVVAAAPTGMEADGRSDALLEFFELESGHSGFSAEVRGGEVSRRTNAARREPGTRN